MEFFIKRYATLPLLKLQVVKDGRSDYNNFMKLLETSTIFFSMVNFETGIPKIMSKPAGFVEKTFIDPNAEPEYYIYYQFTNTDTNLIGKYEGQFLVKTDDGNLILPIREKLFIYVQESFIADDLTYENCYTSVYPCCIGPGYPTPTPSVTPTPTPEQILINPIITENDEYIEVGNDEYLQFVNPTINYNIDVYVSSGSVVTTFTVTTNIGVNQITTIPINVILDIVGGGSITITANVIILNNQLIGQSISNNPLINYNLLTREGEINVGVITPNNFPTFVTANMLQFEQEPTPTQTPTNTPTPTQTPVISSFFLLFDNIVNANTLVGNASNVSDWNIFFDLPTYGTPFTSVNVVGNEVRLFGGENIIMKQRLFKNNQNLLIVNDTSGCAIELEFEVFSGGKVGNNITSINLPSVMIVDYETFYNCNLLVELGLPQLTTAGYLCFADCVSLISINLPSLITAGTACFSNCIILNDINLPQVTNIGDECFSGSDSLETINLPLCEFLGSSVGDNNVFNGIFGNTITITIPSLLMTCNGGNPDGDIVELQTNNTVTIITT
jgi:hypothetical protein